VVELIHRMVAAPAGRIHLVEAGTGPLILLVHGFPEGWRSWRHQLLALAQAGYRAAAIDVRGYGRSSKPSEASAYRLLDHVADNVAVIRALGVTEATVIGHDWGSPIAATSALLHPEVFTAVGLLSVPYSPPGGPRPSEVLAAMGTDPQFYVAYFQQPGAAEAEIEPDVRGWLTGFYAALAGDAATEPEAPWFLVPSGRAMRANFPARAGLPPWLEEADVDLSAAEFERTGFAYALNRYRCMDLDWGDLAHLSGATIEQPSLFAIGEHDASRSWLAQDIDEQPRTMPGLITNEVIPGLGHWLQQEDPDQINKLLLRWLDQAERS
jgi:pimeloyl-ACP methyl ester carboxylesterase